MGLLTEIINRIRMYPQPVVQVYLNKNTLDLLNDAIDHLSENDYNYFSSLGLENTMLVIDMELQDNYFELR